MKTKKLIIAMLIVLAAATCCFLVACSDAEKPNNDIPEGNETGMYYFDNGEESYMLTLNSGNRFTLFIDQATKSGTYTIASGSITLTFKDDDGNPTMASLSGDTVTLSYGAHTSMKFKKMIYYTVTFDSKQGSAVESKVVLNGKKVEEPQNPVRGGYSFVGWYSDEACTIPYNFAATEVSKDIKLYARWVNAISQQTEYDIKYDLGYDNLTLETQTTVGGKLYNMYKPEREGFDFGGWWISMYSDKDKLTDEVDENTVFGESTTLFAVWHDKSAQSSPINVKVTDKLISWTGVANAKYTVNITSSNNIFEAVEKKDIPQALYEIDFSSLPAGDYVIKVTSSTGVEETRYYRNKGLNKVSSFTVSPEKILFFNAVPNAEKYYLTIVCGDENHREHEKMIDLGTRTAYDFSGCTLGEDGISFVVTATAEDYLETTSDTFVYYNKLAPVENLQVNEATQTLTWNVVPYATEYMVTVDCANPNHDHAQPVYTSKCEFSLKECMPKDGKITVGVTARAKGFSSPAPSPFVYEKVSLPAPSNIVVGNDTISWNVVGGAVNYSLRIRSSSISDSDGNIDVRSSDNQSTDPSRFEYKTQSIQSMLIGDNVTISVMANSEDASRSSLWSDPVPVNISEIEQLEYYRNVLSWKAVVSATSYEVKIGDETPHVVKDNHVTISNGSELSFVRGGINKITVRAIFADNTYSEEGNIEVYVYTVSFDTDGGSYIGDQFYAKGDELELPQPSKTNYDFVAWYNLLNGGALGGKNYSLIKFFEDDGDVKLYAYYIPKQMTVQLNYAGYEDRLENCKDEAGKLITEVKVSFNENFTLPVPTVKEDKRWIFCGWFKDPGGTGEQYTNELGEGLKTWTKEETVTAYAYWVQPIEFVLTTDRKGYNVTKSETKDNNGKPYINIIKNIVIPDTYKGLPVLAIDNYAFTDVTTLVSLSIPETIERITYDPALRGCSSLEAVNVYHVEGAVSPKYGSEDGVLYSYVSGGMSIVFVPTQKKGQIRILDGTKSISYDTFNGKDITSVYIPKSVTSISRLAFDGCASLKYVKFEMGKGSALEIGAGAFSQCTALEEIVLPARTKSIGDNAFFYCTKLQGIMIEGGSKYYYSQDGVLFDYSGNLLCFPAGSQLKDYKIPNGITRIADYACSDIKSLESVELPITLSEIGHSAFYLSGIKRITFQEPSKSSLNVIGEYAFAASWLTSIELPSVKVFTRIPDYAFYRCANLSEITIPEGVTEIGYKAFENSGVITVHLPSTLKKLGNRSFAGCSKLRKFYYNGTLSQWKNVQRVSSLTQNGMTWDGRYEYTCWLYDSNRTVSMTFSDDTTEYYDTIR